MKNLFLFLSLLLVCSCTVQKRKHQNGYYVSWHAKHAKKEEHKNSPARTTLLAEVKTALLDKESKQAATDQDLKSVNQVLKDVSQSIRAVAPPEDTCDILVFRDGSEIKAKVQEISISEIKYKRCDNVEGPVYTSKKTDMFMIKYANGTREVIKTEAPTPRVQSPEQNNSGNVRNYRQQRYKRQNHPLALVSLVFGAIGLALGYVLLLLLLAGGFFPIALFLLPLLAALIAVLAGKTALNRIREQPDVFKGKRMAVPGFIFGMVVLGIYAIIAFIFLLFILIVI